MAANGITSLAQRSAFLAQIGVESQNLQRIEEDLYYTTASLVNRLFRSVTTDREAETYLRNPEGLANRVYAGRNGNGNEASGDGWRFRGRGLIQITGRDNYRATGYEGNPDIVNTPENAAVSAGRYWRVRGLNSRSVNTLDYRQFYALVGRVNAGHERVGERWQAYQRALRTLGEGEQP